MPSHTPRSVGRGKSSLVAGQQGHARRWAGLAGVQRSGKRVRQAEPRLKCVRKRPRHKWCQMVRLHRPHLLTHVDLP